MELHNFMIRDPDIEIGLTKITSFIWYSWFTVIIYRYICNKLLILSNALLRITIHSDYAHPMFPYRVRMWFCCIFIYAMAKGKVI